MARFEIYKYNPDRYSYEELDETTVGRDAILAEIVDELHARADSPSNQHFLVTGPRGIGKTNLLLLVLGYVQRDKDLSTAYVPVRTAEEEYSIAGARDFFLRILELLEEAAPGNGLDVVREKAAYMPDGRAATDVVVDALKEFCRKRGQKILLLMDNIDLIIGDQIKDQAEIGRLRDVLMNDSFLVLIGASPTYFREVKDYDRPFYNFFKHVSLEDLSLEQMEQMLLIRAKQEANAGMLERFEELKPRLKAIHHLTGGNPRLVLMLYQVYAHTELAEARTALQMMLDDVTPYYKDRLEKLKPQQRKAMDTFARLGRPATPTEIAREIRLPVNQVTSILNRLRDLGFVTLAPQERRRTTLYMVSERVFRIWHQMRFSARGRRRLEFLIEFIRIWYTQTEWEHEITRLADSYRQTARERLSSATDDAFEHLGYMIEAAPDPELGYEAAGQTIHACIESGDHQHAEEMLTNKLRDYERQNSPEHLAGIYFLIAYLRNEQGKREEEIAALAKAIEYRPDWPEAFNNWGTALSAQALTRQGREREELLWQALSRVESAVALAREKGVEGILVRYHSHLVFTALRLSAACAMNENLGQAQEAFQAALDYSAGADKDDWRRNLVKYVAEVLSRRHVEFYEGILDLLHESGLKDEAELLTPFTIAAGYWKKGDDVEVLDRLNPEVRKLVEQIIETAAGPPLE